MRLSFLRPLLLMMCVIATISISGCTPEGTGHVEDKTPPGETTPPITDMKGMEDYAAEQAKKTSPAPTP